MKRIAVFTGTRAEYGLLYWLLKEIKASDLLQLQLIVSGTHLSPEFGETWKKIDADGFDIDAKVEMLLSSDSATAVAKSMGLGSIGFADTLARLNPDLLVVLGDRFEAFAIVQVAHIMGIPVAHLHGGEITQGAYDDAIRHAISKMSYLHFTAAEAYRKRVIQMGESPERVFNVGAIGLDQLQEFVPMDHKALSDSLNFKLNSDFFLVTYHPVTLIDEDPEKSFLELLNALDAFPSHQIILTYPNADNGGRAIIPILQNYAKNQTHRIFSIKSLGFRRYFSLLKIASAVIGNSSSGIIEAPAFNLPTVNIGARQMGRLAADSIVHCDAKKDSIVAAIRTAISDEFISICQNTISPYSFGCAAKKIVNILETHTFSVEKTFFDMELKHER